MGERVDHFGSQKSINSHRQERPAKLTAQAGSDSWSQLVQHFGQLVNGQPGTGDGYKHKQLGIHRLVTVEGVVKLWLVLAGLGPSRTESGPVASPTGAGDPSARLRVAAR